MEVKNLRISELKPHPRNYRVHNDEQLEHLKSSIEQFGFYRNIAVSADGFILAGHGIVEALTELGREVVPCRQMIFNHDEPKALKLLTADNELGHFANVDDRILLDIISEIDKLDDLLGTGFNQERLAEELVRTRTEEEVLDVDEARDGLGGDDKGWTVKVSFQSVEAREAFIEKYGVRLTDDKDDIGTWATDDLEGVDDDGV